ncbi:MAG: sigma-70 family RNA polymerase sigma factor [Comamonadaceae bacterium]|nr:MAG: sigma-70 family RNA polymerase sigma factor [Comamonadaceae bacterium]
MEAGDADSVQELALWRRLREQGDESARERLFDTHLPYARTVAAVYYGRRFSDDVEFSDYLQYARLGLVEAMDRYDPGRGVQFRTFAARRMHGAILNGLERFTEKHQQIAARRRIRAERLQDVKTSALADARELPHDAQKLLRYVSEVGLGLAVCWMLEGTGMVENGDTPVAAPFYETAALRQLRDGLRNAVQALSPQERLVVQGHYFQDQSFHDIAATLQVTKGRVSQIHRQALLRLRALVREQAGWSTSF